VCDFRGPSEVEADGPDKLPSGAELVEVPIFDADNDLSDKIRTAITSGDAAQQEALLGDGKAEQVLKDAGRTFVEDASAREQFGTVMERIADGESLPAFTHCTAGKDRTGWSTAVLLTALGVPRETVIEDYLLTNEYAAAKNEERIQQVQSLMENPELLRAVLEVRKEYIQSSFDAVDAEYGSMPRYLRKGLGLTAADIAALRANLLTD
jgi:protein-tyrosine phosphatase